MKKLISQGTGSLLLEIAFALCIRCAFMEAYVIPSGSMLPTLLVNDHIFVNKASFGLRVPFTSDWLFQWGEPSRGDVVVFRYPADPRYYYIKRVIGVPGDLIEYRRGYVYINGEVVERLVPAGDVKADWQWLSDKSFIGDQNGLSDYTHWQESIGRSTYSVLLNEQGSRQIEYEPFRVPDRHFFVMGDNRDNSQDSRHWASRERRAKGSVTFSMQSDLKEPIEVPAGTVVKTDLIRGLSRRYRTTEAVSVKPGQASQVGVEALSPGLEHNVSARQIKTVESEPLNGLLTVANTDSILGGEDFRYVPRSYVVGRAMFVWLSCEKTLPILTFLCDPTTVRWSRFFHDVD